MNNIPDFLKLQNIEKYVDDLCTFLHDDISEKFQKSGAIVGLSGGIDSTVTMALCAKALDSTKTLGLTMFEKESDPSNKILISKIAEAYDIENSIVMSNCIINIPIKIRNSIISSYSQIQSKKNPQNEKIFLLGEGTRIFL